MNIYSSSQRPDAALTEDAAATLALQALAWLLGRDLLAERFIGLTGLTPETLRQRADQPDVLAAVTSFLLAHEPDLIACAADLGVPPARLAKAHSLLAEQPAC